MHPLPCWDVSGSIGKGVNGEPQSPAQITLPRCFGKDEWQGQSLAAWIGTYRGPPGAAGTGAESVETMPPAKAAESPGSTGDIVSACLLHWYTLQRMEGVGWAQSGHVPKRAATQHEPCPSTKQGLLLLWLSKVVIPDAIPDLGM